MTDNAIEIYDEVPLDLSLALGDLGPAPAAANKMALAKISLMQGTSQLAKDPTSGVRAGQFVISFDRQGITPPIVTDTLRVVVLDWFMGRVMYPFDPDTGARKQGADVKPACGSNNGVNPRLGEQAGYVGKTYTDYRRRSDGSYAEWTIVSSCENCPLSKWLPIYDFDKQTGKVKLNDKGEPMKKKGDDGQYMNATPPCAKTITYVVYLPDYGIPARLQVSGTVMTAIKTLADFFAVNASGARPNVVDNRAKCVRLTPKMASYRGNAPSWTLDLGWDAAFLDTPQTLRWLELLQMYKDMAIRDMLTGTGYIEEEQEEGEPVDVGMDTATAKSKLGANGKGKRRIAAEDTADPFGDE